MPIGIQRLNAKKSHPNDRIVFIKPLKGPDEAIAKDYLERIAAQCLPIMREHHLSVMSLEEYKPNAEFVGRNFNAGEVVQLVLKTRGSGRWLPFQYVQMVMMHELAHCMQMNHSRAFWDVRNRYADQMRLLWGRGYTGDGLWGRGALLGTGAWEKDPPHPGETLPEHLCGGTYSSHRSRKRKAKAGGDKLTYQEQKERRIREKFGPDLGQTVGENMATKMQLEKGRVVAARPRVARSKRGRELRAAAALARFDRQKGEKKEEEGVKDEDLIVVGEEERRREQEDGIIEIKDESATESEYETDDGGDGDGSGTGAVDRDGTRLLDGKGRALVKVCEDENPDDQDAQREMEELWSSANVASSQKAPPPRPPGVRPSLPGLNSSSGGPRSTAGSKSTLAEQPPSRDAVKKDAVNRREGRGTRIITPKSETPPPPAMKTEDANGSPPLLPLYEIPAAEAGGNHRGGRKPHRDHQQTEPCPRQEGSEPEEGVLCSACSFRNRPCTAPVVTCAVCANVLDPTAVPGSWACGSVACRGSGGGKYHNSADCGVCGVCGGRRGGGGG